MFYINSVTSAATSSCDPSPLSTHPHRLLAFPEVHVGCEYLYARFSHASVSLFTLLKEHHLCAECSVALFEIQSEAGLCSREDACVLFPVKLYEQFSCD